MNRLLTLTVLTLVCTATTVQAQSRQYPAPRQSRPIAILGATLHNPPAEVDGTDEVVTENAYILFDEGRILATGSGDPGNLEGYETLDAEGLHVFPGLIAGPTQIGLIETMQVRATDDRSEYLGRLYLFFHRT